MQSQTTNQKIIMNPIFQEQIKKNGDDTDADPNYILDSSCTESDDSDEEEIDSTIEKKTIVNLKTVYLVVLLSFHVSSLPDERLALRFFFSKISFLGLNAL